eukprot:5546135-Amphidinium_carterae.1
MKLSLWSDPIGGLTTTADFPIIWIRTCAQVVAVSCDSEPQLDPQHATPYRMHCKQTDIRNEVK